jgi:hypothetical protein
LGPELAQLASKKLIATKTIIAFINTLRTFVSGKPGQVDCSLFTPHDNAAMAAEGFDTFDLKEAKALLYELAS